MAIIRIHAWLAIVIALDLICAATVSAQTRVATLDELRRALKPGDVISVVPATGDPLRGRLLRLDDTALDIRGDTRVHTVPLAAIRTLERRRDSTSNGTLIGASIGGGVGGALFLYALAVDRNEIDEWAPILLAYGFAFTGVGALVGWAADVANSKPHVRFDAGPGSARRVAVSPMFGRKRGVALVVRF